MSHKLKGIGETKYLPEIIPSETVEADSVNNGAIRATASHKFETPPDMLIGRLSFSHIREIMAIDDPFERWMQCRQPALFRRSRRSCLLIKLRRCFFESGI